jgi:hypothetical protein
MSETTEEIQAVAVAAPKKQKKLKPARKQVKPGDVVKTEAPQTGKEYSKLSLIFHYTVQLRFRQIFGTTSGQEETAKTVIPSLCSSLDYSQIADRNACSKVKSQTRCNIKRDSGLTRANVTGIKYTCLYFARGCCPYGWECEYLHMLPDPNDQLPDSSKDCFARDKFSDYRDDMGGVGSFNRQNRTLYIGRIKETGNGLETEEVVMRHFKEWGQIEHGGCSSSAL